jgi:hypothetical protein
MISVSFSGVALDNRLRLESLGGIFISMLYSIKGISEGNRPSALELIVTLDL